jgi:hypothetical protein
LRAKSKTRYTKLDRLLEVEHFFTANEDGAKMKKEKWMIVFYLMISLICLGFYFLLSGLVMLILAGIALFGAFVQFLRYRIAKQAYAKKS